MTDAVNDALAALERVAKHDRMVIENAGIIEDAVATIRAAVVATSDNERTALIEAINRELGWEWESSPAEFIPSSLEVLGDIADAVHAAGFRLRPDEWQYSIAYPDKDGKLLTDGANYYATRERADAELAKGVYLDNDVVVRRTAPGPWEVAPDAS